MCLQIPLRVKEVQEEYVSVEDERKLLYKLSEPIEPGDYVYAFGNIVVAKLQPAEAKKRRSLLKKTS